MSKLLGICVHTDGGWEVQLNDGSGDALTDKFLSEEAAILVAAEMGVILPPKPARKPRGLTVSQLSVGDLFRLDSLWYRLVSKKDGILVDVISGAKGQPMPGNTKVTELSVLFRK